MSFPLCMILFLFTLNCYAKKDNLINVCEFSNCGELENIWIEEVSENFLQESIGEVNKKILELSDEIIETDDKDEKLKLKDQREALYKKIRVLEHARGNLFGAKMIREINNIPFSYSEEKNFSNSVSDCLAGKSDIAKRMLKNSKGKIDKLCSDLKGRWLGHDRVYYPDPHKLGRNNGPCEFSYTFIVKKPGLFTEGLCSLSVSARLPLNSLKYRRVMSSGKLPKECGEDVEKVCEFNDVDLSKDRSKNSVRNYDMSCLWKKRKKISKGCFLAMGYIDSKVVDSDKEEELNKCKDVLDQIGQIFINHNTTPQRDLPRKKIKRIQQIIQTMTEQGGASSIQQ